MSPPPTHANPKRRQYAAGQTQAYYGAAEGGGGGGLDSGYGAGVQQQQQPPAQGQLFTPGLAAEQQFAGQQQQPTYFQPQEPGYGNDAGYGQSQPGYPQQQAPQVGALADQFGNMAVGGQPVGGQKPFQLYTANLLTSPPDPRELSRPPPEIRLPPNACLSPSPTANADPSYLRCTLNAIPTTSSLLNKCKIPLGLVITPYRSLAEGESVVPLVTDTIIARCRRCRTYINPFVQFIDGGNRYVHKIQVVNFSSYLT